LHEFQEEHVDCRCKEPNDRSVNYVEPRARPCFGVAIRESLEQVLSHQEVTEAPNGERCGSHQNSREKEDCASPPGRVPGEKDERQIHTHRAEKLHEGWGTQICGWAGKDKNESGPPTSGAGWTRRCERDRRERCFRVPESCATGKASSNPRHLVVCFMSCANRWPAWGS
jgi:hypothetical protein